ETDNISITLTKNPDILSLLCHSQLKPKVVVGFAAESENVIGNAKIKLNKKKCDVILANDISENNIFGSDENKIYIVKNESVTELPKMHKNMVANHIINAIW
ncbi:MAG: bifunctional phosphopantothenoylcysteine decarboxylase/phosphopantothenate--cysteine ligase CoaBC, partial [Rickettsiales bacterium]|nr:bifunctional phosphopantothenoylcysteine decarboxylase/phosphopantothenate--cysteine ligase CoaBC [Rickettsiales bacterium]